MPTRLAERLRAARDRLFVGREAELARFRAALEAEAFPVHVLHVFGPGGVGKTSLLRAFLRLCRAGNVAARYLDGRDVEPEPQAFLAALREALGLPPGERPLEALAARAERLVLLVDTYETIAALDGWLRERFLPALPEHVLVVLAGRDVPAPAWRVDPGWQALVEMIPLRNLDAEDGRAFLRRRAVPEDQFQAILAFTHGHPLATSLVADLIDQQPQRPFEPSQAPDVVKTLLEQFVQQVPGPAHRAALEACALVRFTTEDTLKELLDAPDAHALFAWLRGLSFIDAAPRGLFPHDLAREVLAADLRWRNPDRHADLHRRARRCYTARLKHADAQTDHTVLSDYLFLQRDHPLVRPFFARLQSQWEASDPILPDAAQAADWPALAAMVEQHEGPQSARLARRWFERQPEGVHVFRDDAGQRLGFTLTLTLDRAAPADRAADPATHAAWRYLETRAPLRPGEHATMFRFWMARETYQDVSPVQSLIAVRRVRHYLGTPGLAFSFVPCRDPAFWEMLFAFADIHRLPEAGFELDGHAYGVFGHDWRAVPPAAWLDLIAERSAGMTTPAAPAPRPEPIIVLSRSGFDDALRDALRGFARPGMLHGNPLLRARMVIDRTGLDADEAARSDALCRLLEDAAAALAASPRDARYFRAVHGTYFEPAPSQEQAAERMGLPFSTFRRHLKRGLARLAEILWEQETGNVVRET